MIFLFVSEKTVLENGVFMAHALSLVEREFVVVFSPLVKKNGGMVFLVPDPTVRQKHSLVMKVHVLIGVTCFLVKYITTF